jgi:denticleless
MILDCHREHVATTSAHASARPGARDPLHRHASLHAFLRGRELVRTASNTTLRPGVRDFVSGAPEPRAHAHDEDAFFERRAARRLFPGAGRAAEGTRDPRRRWGSVSVSEGYGAEAADDRPLAPFVVRFCRREDGSATPNEKLLAVAGEDGAVTVVDVGAPAEGFRGFGNASAFPSFEVKRRFRAHDNAVFDTRWCRGSERLVTASGDGTARLFDAETAAELGAFRFHRGTVKAVAVRPGSGGDVFASCGRDGALALWDARVVSRARGDAGEPAARPVAAVERAHEDTGLKGKTKTKTKRNGEKQRLRVLRGVRARRAGSALRRRGGRFGEALGRASTAKRLRSGRDGGRRPGRERVRARRPLGKRRRTNVLASSPRDHVSGVGPERLVSRRGVVLGLAHRRVRPQRAVRGPGVPPARAGAHAVQNLLLRQDGLLAVRHAPRLGLVRRERVRVARGPPGGRAGGARGARGRGLGGGLVARGVRVPGVLRGRWRREGVGGGPRRER